MSPLSAPVLGGAALISAPALWGAFVTGTTPTEVALTRFLVCAVLCWAGLAVVAPGGPRRRARRARRAAPPPSCRSWPWRDGRRIEGAWRNPFHPVNGFALSVVYQSLATLLKFEHP